MSTRLYKKLPTQLWQLSTSFLPIPYIVSHVPRVSKFFDMEIVWNANTSSALMWQEMPTNNFYDLDFSKRYVDHEDKVTLLALACSMGAPVHHVRILLQTAPDSIHVLDHDGQFSPLWHADCREDIVDLLLKSNADPSLMYNGDTLIFRACMNRCYEVAELLLNAYDANVNCDCRGGITALQISFDEGRRHDIARLLLRHGATPTMESTRILSQCQCWYCEDVNCDSAISE